MIKLFSTNCPKCKLLEGKLNSKNVNYEVCTDIEEMKSLKIMSVPVLQLDDGTLLSFGDAVRWVNSK